MNKLEVLNAINNALAALREYKRITDEEPANFLENYDDRAIKQAWEEFRRVSFTIQPAGNPCRCCHGTGVD